MRRTDFLMKVMSGLLFVAIAVYIGVYLYNTAENPLKTTPAVRYTVEDSGSAEGYIVRDETVLPENSGAVSVLAAEGQKVASGQTLAVRYADAAALAHGSEVKALQLKISAAEADADASAETKAAEANSTVLLLASAIEHKNLENLESLKNGVATRIFTEAGGSVTPEALKALKDRLSALTAGSAEITTITAPHSGVFSAAVDGFEAVKPAALDGLVPSSLTTLFAAGEKQAENTTGKLITGITWYYAALLTTDDAQKLQEAYSAGKKADLQFKKTYNAELLMKIESIGQPEGGKCVVVFSSKTNLSEMTALRKLTAQIKFSSYTGLLVPKEAVHQDEANKPYIYLLTGLQAEQVYITILGTSGNNDVVQDGAVGGSVLREGAMIIVEAKDLYKGKVVLR